MRFVLDLLFWLVVWLVVCLLWSVFWSLVFGLKLSECLPYIRP
jgi:hypothetical protein